MSLRFRLPLTYALIAFLANFILGSVLLSTLASYYRNQESAYLAANGPTISEIVHSYIDYDAPYTLDIFPPEVRDDVEAQLRAFSFLTQTRVKVLDITEFVLIDSGSASEQIGRVEFTLGVQSGDVSQTVSQQIALGEPLTTTLTVAGGGQAIDARIVSKISPPFLNSTDPLPALGGFPNLYSAYAAEQSPSLASSLVSWFRTPIMLNGETVGYIELSEGPTLAGTVLQSVRRGLQIGRVVSVVLATLAGFWVSRGVTRPLSQLTTTTEQMAAGNLSARSDVQRRDEVGQLATTFNTMAERVEHTVDVHKRFAADAAHELHTPMTALKTRLELAQQSAEPAQLQAALDQTDRLIHLTTSLLQLSRAEGAGEDAPHVVIDLATFLPEHVEPFAARAEQQDVTFTFNQHAESATVSADVDSLQRIVDNLLDNALKFTSADGEIELGLASENGAVMLTVRDTGIGLSGPAERVFERFYRDPNAASYPGSGIGLAIVHKLVMQLGGVISAEAMERGTCFVVTLPQAV